MTLNQTKTQGFTIVELLIVIVVIGILAAVTVVAYTGITRQANINTVKSNASSVADAANAYNAAAGQYPPSAASGVTSFSTTSNGVTISSPGGVTLTANGLGTTNTSLNTVIYVANSARTGACVGYAYEGHITTGNVILLGSATGFGSNATPTSGTSVMTCS